MRRRREDGSGHSSVFSDMEVSVAPWFSGVCSNSTRSESIIDRACPL